MVPDKMFGFDRTKDRPKGNIVKSSQINEGGSTIKTYFSKSGVFVRLFISGTGVYWYKQNPIFVDHMGNFYT